ncbi:MAG: HNH endonuclease [Deltaproteobacteria bacterium]|nr:HNH endonuclease [Myxococcales bacterium]MDP3217286.1 HNH endonuclease [Deltaproteobacteria bacterium]
MTTTEERFWRSASPEGECLVWQGSRFWNNYGRFRVGGRSRIASRVAWEFARGLIPEGAHVLHRCDNPPCVNPEHLFLGSHADNMADMVAKGRQAQGELASGAVLTADDMAQARALRAGGSTYGEIAAQLGVSHACIYAALNGVTWRCLGEAPPLPQRAPSTASKTITSLFADGRGRSTAEVRRELGISKEVALYRLKHTPGIVHVRLGLWAPAASEAAS